jgi:hypothetical protein
MHGNTRVVLTENLQCWLTLTLRFSREHKLPAATQTFTKYTWSEDHTPADSIRLSYRPDAATKYTWSEDRTPADSIRLSHRPRRSEILPAYVACLCTERLLLHLAVPDARAAAHTSSASLMPQPTPAAM